MAAHRLIEALDQGQKALVSYLLDKGANVNARTKRGKTAGNPAVVPGTTPAKPGDILMLWGTGFGATNPPTAPGVVVNGTPPLAALPAVTVGGVAATVLGAALSDGTVGLYQVNIQLPSNVPIGR
ncbi:MAG TPA: hypothetical protein VIX14_07900 [Terriglobales bacterium]